MRDRTQDLDSLDLDLTSEETANRLDRCDPLAWLRGQFHIPPGPGGVDQVYFAGNSLGLQPVTVEDLILEELRIWREEALGGHFGRPTAWLHYHELVRESLARIVGAQLNEVLAMNGLTVNLHLMMASFYRPNGLPRRRILMEADAFPSDVYAVQTQLEHHGWARHEDRLIVCPRSDEHTIRTEDIEQAIEKQGESIALVLIGGVNYITSQVFDMKRITECAHRHGSRSERYYNCTLGSRVHGWNT